MASTTRIRLVSGWGRARRDPGEVEGQVEADHGRPPAVRGQAVEALTERLERDELDPDLGGDRDPARVVTDARQDRGQALPDPLLHGEQLRPGEHRRVDEAEQALEPVPVGPPVGLDQCGEADREPLRGVGPRLAVEDERAPRPLVDPGCRRRAVATAVVGPGFSRRRFVLEDHGIGTNSYGAIVGVRVNYRFVFGNHV